MSNSYVLSLKTCEMETAYFTSYNNSQIKLHFSAYSHSIFSYLLGGAYNLT